MDGIEIYFLKKAGKVRKSIRIATYPGGSGCERITRRVGIQGRNGSLGTLISVAPVQGFGNDVVQSHVHISTHSQPSSSDRIRFFRTSADIYHDDTGLSTAGWGIRCGSLPHDDGGPTSIVILVDCQGG